MLSGEKLIGIEMFTRPNNNAVTACEFVLRFNTGDFTGTLDSNAEMTTNDFLTKTLDITGNDHKKQSLGAVNFTAPSDGYLIPCFKPTVGGTNTRYIAVNMILDIQRT